MLIIKYIILTAKKNGTSEDTVSWSLVALGQTQQTPKAADRLLPRITELHVLALQELHTSGTWSEDKVREVAQTTRTLLKANHLQPNENPMDGAMDERGIRASMRTQRLLLVRVRWCVHSQMGFMNSICGSASRVGLYYSCKWEV